MKEAGEVVVRESGGCLLTGKRDIAGVGEELLVDATYLYKLPCPLQPSLSRH